MARTQTTVADAITAVNTIVSSQATALAQIKSALQGKAAGSGVDLGALDVYVGDFLTSENYTVTKGSIDGYWSTLVS